MWPNAARCRSHVGSGWGAAAARSVKELHHGGNRNSRSEERIMVLK